MISKIGWMIRHMGTYPNWKRGEMLFFVKNDSALMG